MGLKLENYIPVVANDTTINTDKDIVIRDIPVMTDGIIQVNQGPTAAASFAVSQTVFLNSTANNYKLASVSVVFGTGSTSGTLQVEVATGTQAIASGTNQLTGTVALSGTGNTVASGTLIASPTTIVPGARVNLIIAGTVTNLANASISVTLKKVV